MIRFLTKVFPSHDRVGGGHFSFKFKKRIMVKNFKKIQQQTLLGPQWPLFLINMFLLPDQPLLQV